MMSDAFASWLFDQLAPPVFAGLAFAGVTSLILLIISSFRSLFGEK